MKKITFTPLYLQVKKDILDRIFAGEWPPESFLPNEFVLAKEYGVSQGTLRKALEELTAEKHLIRYQGKGTKVAEINEESSVFPFYLLYDKEQKRIYPSTITLCYEIISVPKDIVEFLNIAEDEQVIHAERIRTHNEKTVLYEEVYIPKKFFSAQILENMKVLPDRLYAFYLTEFGMRVNNATEDLFAVLPEKADIKHLNISENTPLLMVQRTSYDSNNTPVEFRVSKINSTQYTYKINIS